MIKSGVRMAGWTCLFCLMFSACGGQESQKERLLKAFNRSIMYGEPDTSQAHQAVVYLDLGLSACTGTLIADRWVLTAAHCLSGWIWSVDVGFGNQEGSLDYYSAADWWPHPDFSMSNLTYDVGLVELNNQPAGVTPIPYLPPSLEITPADENSLELEFVGFGQTETGSFGTKLTASDVLHWVCTAPGGCDLGGGAHASQNTICYDQDPGGPCSGDSGGPAFVWRNGQEYVGGITSYGDEGCLVFGCSTKADAYQDWIVEIMGGGENGNPCTAASQCNSGYCVDGVCCESACSGDCQVCNLSPAGTCQAAPNGTPCPDADLCDGEETCQNGTCQATTPTDCDDNNPCTTDSCNSSVGCVFNPVQNGTSCADDNLCNGEEYCSDGVCLVDEFLDCDDQNPCTSDSCLPATGCLNQQVPDGTPCPNGSLCDGDESCAAGVCQSGSPLDCDDGDVCTTDACDPEDGCYTVPAPAGTPCDDGNICTEGDVCQSGLCTQGAQKICDDHNLCTQDTCDPATGCIYQPLPDGTSCGGGLCGEATCTAGQCVPGDETACDDSDPCTRDWCDPARGCVFDPLPDGHECGECLMCLEHQCVDVPDCEPSGGCSCSSGRDSRPAAPAFLLLLLLALLRRR